MKKFVHQILVFVIFGFLSCSKDPQPIPVPVINSMSPVAGIPKMVVTITGNNFSKNISENSVSFNGVPAIIDSASSSKLVVVVPDGGTTGPVKITTKGGTASGQVFRYYDVYIVWTETNSNNKNVIKVWRNGSVQSLTDETSYSDGIAFTVSGEDVYVCGDIFNGTKSLPAYWKNNTAYQLGTENGGGTSIDVVGNDVYICGSEFNGTYFVAKYWKNGTGYVLDDGTYGGSQANAISVVNGDVYVGGGTTNSNQVYVATLWKNGIATTIGDGINNSGIGYMQVVGTDIYAVLESSTPNNSSNYVSLWKNGAQTNLSDGIYNTGATAMTVVGGDVLVTGYEFDGSGHEIPVIWENKRTINLTDGSIPVFTRGIALVGNDIITSGFISVGNNTVVFCAINSTLIPLTNGDTKAIPVGVYAR